MANNIFTKWKEGLDRTRKVAFGRLSSILGTSEITEETWEELEAILVQADIGIDTSLDIIEKLKEVVHEEGLTKAQDLQVKLREELIRRIEPRPSLDLTQHKPTIILVVGVNGSGKTTSIAKLGKIFADQGKRVMFAAADTYRAAAVDQLKIWAERLNIPIIAGQPNADPGAVAYDAVQSAVARKADILLVDTAGRLHTRYNLMEELKKVHRVTGKALAGAPHITWLVLDATTGQNALIQARAFKEAVKVDGVILAKLDSSARGGMTFAIQKELQLPILFAGLGESSDDLEEFSREKFVDSLLG
jgi:fused signal recognition particle receptor